MEEVLFVSAIIAVYNGERFLAGAIKNILQQNYQPLEIIVVDDGSTDKTGEIAAQFQGSIRYVYQPNSGLAAARNQGIKIAQGNVIAFLDVDDLWSENKLALQVGYLAAHPEVEIVQGLIQQMELYTSTLNDEELKFEITSIPYQFINIGSAIYRKSVFDKVGLFDEALHQIQDAVWFIQAWEKRITKAVLQEVTLFYRKHQYKMLDDKNLLGKSFVNNFKNRLEPTRKIGNVTEIIPLDFPSIGNYIGKKPGKTIKDRNYTVISNDCWAIDAYKLQNVMYRTPFIGTRIFAPCYLELLKDLRGYLESPLIFTNVSRYNFMNKQRENRFFPIALLKGKVEIHFHHEFDEGIAKAKWERRLKRINWDNIYVKFSEDSGICTEEHLEAFDQLYFPYKVCFTAKNYPHLKSTIFMPDYFEEGAPMYWLSKKYFDVIGWFNKKHGFDPQFYKL